MQYVARLAHRLRRARALPAAALVFALAGCFVSQSRKEEADAKAQTAYAKCDRLLAAGQYKTHLAAVDCAVPIVTAAYEEAAYPFTDLTYISIQARRIGSRKVDVGEVTETQYQHDLAELDTRLAAEDARRRQIMKYGGAPQPATADALVQGLDAFTPTPTAAALPISAPGTQAACVPLGAIRRCP